MRRETFDECINKGHLIELGVCDTSMAQELLILANHRLKFWKSIADKAKDFPSIFIEGYYVCI